MKKIYIKKLKGFIFIESYNQKKNEENGRAKIFDSNKNYIDYISLEETTKKEYNQIVKEYKKIKDISDLIENMLFYNSYDYSPNLEYLLYSILDGQPNEIIDELENDLKTKTENELILKYTIKFLKL